MITAPELGSPPHPVGFHEGELLVQHRAGVAAEGRRLERMLDLPDLAGGAERFLADRTFVVLTGRGGDGRLWTSPLRGPAGFLRGSRRSLRVGTAPGPGDPLNGLKVGEQVGLVAIEFAARRRVRINGRLSGAGPDWLEIEVDQAYGNCPQYIRRRSLVSAEAASQDAGLAEYASQLSAADRALVAAADTFFLGTAHPTRGADASHRGGPTGFVRTDGARLSWPDLPGNNMFNSLGNLAADHAAALLFIDWSNGAVLELSGTADVEWVDLPVPDGDGSTGRVVHFTTEAVVRRQDSSLRVSTT